jgi:hypothetical protein
MTIVINKPQLKASQPAAIGQPAAIDQPGELGIEWFREKVFQLQIAGVGISNWNLPRPGGWHFPPGWKVKLQPAAKDQPAAIEQPATKVRSAAEERPGGFSRPYLHKKGNPVWIWN